MDCGGIAGGAGLTVLPFVKSFTICVQIIMISCLIVALGNIASVFFNENLRLPKRKNKKSNRNDNQTPSQSD
jgi:hypothetical protein